MGSRNRLYPHLLEDDIDLWEEFLAEYGHQYNSFDYDVRVGKGRDPGTIVNEKFRKVGIELSKRRIDVVGFRTGATDIIEITLFADLKALGQLMVYPDLYKQTFQHNEPLIPILVCREIGPDVHQTILKNSIDVRLFPAQGD